LQLSTDVAELERADREHREIVRLCRNGHASAAGALLADHIGHVSTALMAFLGESSPRTPPLKIV
jgi:DNA-binding GntR family transcriptional regulator